MIAMVWCNVQCTQTRAVYDFMSMNFNHFPCLSFSLHTAESPKIMTNLNANYYELLENCVDNFFLSWTHIHKNEFKIENIQMNCTNEYIQSKHKRERIASIIIRICFRFFFSEKTPHFSIVWIFF